MTELDLTEVAPVVVTAARHGALWAAGTWFTTALDPDELSLRLAGLPQPVSVALAEQTVLPAFAIAVAQPREPIVGGIQVSMSSTGERLERGALLTSMGWRAVPEGVGDLHEAVLGALRAHQVVAMPLVAWEDDPGQALWVLDGGSGSHLVLAAGPDDTASLWWPALGRWLPLEGDHVLDALLQALQDDTSIVIDVGTTGMPDDGGVVPPIRLVLDGANGVVMPVGLLKMT